LWIGQDARRHFAHQQGFAKCAGRRDKGMIIQQKMHIHDLRAGRGTHGCAVEQGQCGHQHLILTIGGLRQRCLQQNAMLEA